MGESELRATGAHMRRLGNRLARGRRSMLWLISIEVSGCLDSVWAGVGRSARSWWVWDEIMGESLEFETALFGFDMG